MIDIEERLTLDERAAVDFILDLRKRWSDTVYSALVREFEETEVVAESAEQVTPTVQGLPTYPWFSHLERAQQKMLWRAAGDIVIRRRDELLAELEPQGSERHGELQLNPDLELPSWYTDYDIHIQPGSFYSHDLSGYVYELGARIVMLRDNDGYKFHTLFRDTALPHKPHATRVLDMGCGFGKSTRPLVQRYPKAEVIGMDLSAPGLRLAHAEAEADGLPITYVQADARHSGLEDGSCDVVTGTMFLHEMPSEAIVEAINEAARLLKPGGEMHFLEFMLTGDPVRDATVIEHAERNNEPFFRHLFATDTVQACLDAGLTEARWQAFDERSLGVQPDGWGERPEWHFPWAVLSAKKEM